MLENLLTEQANPASARIDAVPTEEALRIIGPRFPELYVNQIDALVS